MTLLPTDYLYEIRIGEERVYVGRSVSPSARWRKHKKRWPDGSLRVLVSGSHEYICELERAFIARLRRTSEKIQNVAPGGDNPPSHLGRPWSASRREIMRAVQVTPEYRERMSAATRGRPKPEGFGAKVAAALIGKPKSAECRAKIAASRMGLSRPHTETSRQKIAEANRRRVLSDETKAKISASLVRTRELRSQMFKGRVFSEETRRRMSIASHKRWHGVEGTRNP